MIAALYTAWVFYSRYSEAKRIEEQAAQKAAEADRKTIERAGGHDLKILAFYANPSVIKNGETGLLCYSVANAKAVRLEPEGPEITPALTKCVEVKPSKTTAYTMIAEDASGNSVQAEATVRVTR